MFPQLKALRAGIPPKGTTPARPVQATRFGVPARAVRPLGFAAVAVAAAMTVAGCKPGSYTAGSGSGSGSGSQSGTTSSSSPAAQALQLAAQQAQQVSSFTGDLQVQATGALNANLSGTMREVTAPSPVIAVHASLGSLGNVRMILDNGMAYLRSPLLANSYHKPWVMGSYSNMGSSMGSSSGLSLGPLLSLLQASSPQVQTQLFKYGTNMRYMGSSSLGGTGVREYGGHYTLSSILGSVSSSMQPMVRSWMNSGITLTRFRVWTDSTHMVRKLVLIEVGSNTTVTITLTITSSNQPVHITLPSTTVIFVLPGTTTATPTPVPTMSATPTVKPTATATPTPVTGTPTPGMSSSPAAVPSTVPNTVPTHY